jgi:hypothetical protein
MHRLVVAREQALGRKAVPSELIVGEDIAEIEIRGVLLPAEFAEEQPVPCVLAFSPSSSWRP